jgi:hypothetical protein
MPLPDKTLAVVAIVGSRDYPDAEARVLNRLTALKHDWPQIEWLVVSGGAPGVDQAAERAAKQLRLQFHEISAEWDVHGQHAGLLRNQQIVNEVPAAMYGDPSRVIAFWDFQSAGTKDTIQKAILGNRATEIWDADYEPAGHEAARAVFPDKHRQLDLGLA